MKRIVLIGILSILLLGVQLSPAVADDSAIPAKEEEKITPEELQGRLKTAGELLAKQHADASALNSFYEKALQENAALVKILKEGRELVTASETRNRDRLKNLLERAVIDNSMDPLMEALKAGNAVGVSSRLEQLAFEYAGTPLGNAAVKHMLDAFLARGGEFEFKVAEFRTWAATLPAKAAGTAELTLAEAYTKVGQNVLAESEIAFIINADFPLEVKAKAKYLLAALKVSQLDFKGALEILGKLSIDPTAVSFRDRVLYTQAWCLIVTGRNEAGAEILAMLKTDFPDSDYIPRLEQVFKTYQ